MVASPRAARPPAPRFGDELTTLAMAGAVTPTSARIWARSDAAGPHQLVITPAGGAARRAEVSVPAGPGDRTAAWTYPDDVPGAAPLAADTAHGFEVRRGDRLIGEGRFTTAPDPAAPPRPFTFAALSCHQPYGEDGAVTVAAGHMLEAARATLIDRDVRFVLAMGDQMYADYPASRSLFDPAYFARVAPPGRAALVGCTRGEVRALYQQRHRQSWALPAIRALYAAAPSYPMLDDHEVIDNFGSVEAHDGPGWGALRAGALDAFHDYQAARVLPSPPGAARPDAFDHGFRWGGAAIYQLDIRSERHAVGGTTRVFSPAQLVRLRRFLARERSARLLVVMVTVPLVFVPGWAARAAALIPGHQDGTDRWTFAACAAERERLLAILREHAAATPHQRQLLVSGDIHAGTAFEVRWDDGHVVHQLTASALSNEESRLARLLFEAGPRAIARLTHAGLDAEVRLVAPAAGAPARNPYGELNLGLVHVDDDGTRARFQLELIGAAPRPDGSAAPVTVFRSAWL